MSKTEKNKQQKTKTRNQGQNDDREIESPL